MDYAERKFIEAADELYSAMSEIPFGDLTDRQNEAMAAFAAASNCWDDHPAKKKGAH